MNYRQIIIITICVLFGGCAPKVSYMDIHQAYERVNAADGVSRNEAVLIAQKEILKRGLGDRVYSFRPISVERQYVWFDGEKDVQLYRPPADSFRPDVTDKWVLLFKDKENTYLAGIYPVIPIMIEVDAANGDILHFGLKRD